MTHNKEVLIGTTGLEKISKYISIWSSRRNYIHQVLKIKYDMYLLFRLGYFALFIKFFQKLLREFFCKFNTRKISRRNNEKAFCGQLIGWLYYYMVIVSIYTVTGNILQ